MSAAAAIEPRVVRASPGRLRLHLAGWDGRDPGVLEGSLVAISGVLGAQARPATGNVLIRYDPAAAAPEGLLDAVRSAASRRRRRPSRGAKATEPRPPTDEEPRPPSHLSRVSGVLRDGAGRFGRARIAVRGIDRDPQLARRVTEILERRPEVRRAIVSATTGRVLVEFSCRVSSIQDLLSDISSVELPDLPGEGRPAHPLDPAPIIQSGARVAGSTLGLGLLAARRALGAEGAPVAARGPAAVAGALGIIDGAPPLREGLRSALGRDRAQLLLNGAAIVSLTLSGSPLGLLVSGAGALRLFTEARLRREAWEEYERRLRDSGDAQVGAVVRLEAGARVPLRGHVVEGVGTTVGPDGLADGVGAGSEVPAGARVLRGPIVVELAGEPAWSPQPRPSEPPPNGLERYLALIGPAATAYAAVHAVRRRSLGAAFTGLLLVNPRPALIGSEAADTGASARVLRAGVTVVGTRPGRQIRRPDLLLIDSPRVLTSGLEQTRIVPVGEDERGELSELVSAMMAASGAPWGASMPLSHHRQATDAEFDGIGVSATVSGRQLRLEPPRAAEEEDPGVRRARDAGEQTLVLRDGERRLAHVHLRPRLTGGLPELRRRCREHHVRIAVLERGDRRAARALARRAGVELILEADLVELVREHQRRGERVAVLSDTPAAAEAFEACDLGIGLSSGRSSHFQARADLLAPGLAAVAAVISAGARRDQSSDISVGLSALANVAGGVWGLQGAPGLQRASHATYVGTLAALAAGWERLRGGRRSRSIVSRLADPGPERWGRMSVEDALGALGSSEEGLSPEEASARRRTLVRPGPPNVLVSAISEQLRSPLVAVLGAGAGVSLLMGATADVGIIAAVIAANVMVGAWQERQAGRAAQALERMGAATARVRRAGEVVEVPAGEVVPGDLLVLGAGDRVVADGRLVSAEALELDEAALTGESLPTAKALEAERPESRIVLEGSDVTVGSGVAVVAAVGEGTRLGATAAALAVHEPSESPLAERLNRLFRQGLPLVIAGGAVVTLAGIAWGGAPLAQLAVGASVAVAAVPEGLPLLAGVASAAAARRLAERKALVRRLTSVEALGRVDVVCTDKTGTLTRGELSVTLIDDLREDRTLPGSLGDRARAVLLTAALASPPPSAEDAHAHPTDAAVLDAAVEARLEPELGVERRAEAPFDPVRSLHATTVPGRTCVKGATEVVLARCTRLADPGGGSTELDEAGRAVLLDRAESLAARGLRVLMVAEGPETSSAEDPRELTALGFVGIGDPLRAGVKEALRRCQEAGVRVIMLTGDHPATARAIAADAGLPLGPGAVLTGEEITEVENGALAERLERASVIARITPIDKLRIVEWLQRSGHIVAMTGDGVNDAPALRLADVGVAMGAGGTEVARQAADLVLADDRFETLTDALLEGRSLWQNLHGALGLLLGGNLGEVGLMVGAALAGRTSLLSARQILAVNLVTDVLPAVAVAVQAPRESVLEHITAEGRSSFDSRLARDILRRGTATAVPALGALLLAAPMGAQATTVAFSSIIVTQLAQTLQAGRRQQQLSPSVLGAIAGSGGLLGLALAVPGLRGFLGLTSPTPAGLALIAATAPAAALLASRLADGNAGTPAPAAIAAAV